jgi:hypothetical protein
MHVQVQFYAYRLHPNLMHIESGPDVGFILHLMVTETHKKVGLLVNWAFEWGKVDWFSRWLLYWLAWLSGHGL